MISLKQMKYQLHFLIKMKKNSGLIAKRKFVFFRYFLGNFHKKTVTFHIAKPLNDHPSKQCNIIYCFKI